MRDMYAAPYEPGCPYEPGITAFPEVVPGPQVTWRGNIAQPCSCFHLPQCHDASVLSGTYFNAQSCSDYKRSPLLIKWTAIELVHESSCRVSSTAPVHLHFHLRAQSRTNLLRTSRSCGKKETTPRLGSPGCSPLPPGYICTRHCSLRWRVGARVQPVCCS